MKLTKNGQNPLFRHFWPKFVQTKSAFWPKFVENAQNQRGPYKALWHDWEKLILLKIWRATHHAIWQKVSWRARAPARQPLFSALWLTVRERRKAASDDRELLCTQLDAQNQPQHHHYKVRKSKIARHLPTHTHQYIQRPNRDFKALILTDQYTVHYKLFLPILTKFLCQKSYITVILSKLFIRKIPNREQLVQPINQSIEPRRDQKSKNWPKFDDSHETTQKDM